MTFGQVGAFRRPVVHLCIDVDRVVAAPRRADHVVPNALEVGRLGAWPRTGNEQITAILKEQGEQVRVVVLLKRANAFIGGQTGCRGYAQVKRHTLEERLVVG